VHVHQVEIHTQLSPPRAISPPHSGLGAQILANFPAPPGAVCFLGHVIKMVGVYAKAHKELIVRRDWPAAYERGAQRGVIGSGSPPGYAAGIRELHAVGGFIFITVGKACLYASIMVMFSIHAPRWQKRNHQPQATTVDNEMRGGLSTKCCHAGCKKNQCSTGEKLQNCPCHACSLWFRLERLRCIASGCGVTCRSLMFRSRTRCSSSRLPSRKRESTKEAFTSDAEGSRISRLDDFLGLLVMG